MSPAEPYLSRFHPLDHTQTSLPIKFFGVPVSLPHHCLLLSIPRSLLASVSSSCLLVSPSKRWSSYPLTSFSREQATGMKALALHVTEAWFHNIPGYSLAGPTTIYTQAARELPPARVLTPRTSLSVLIPNKLLFSCTSSTVLAFSAHSHHLPIYRVGLQGCLAQGISTGVLGGLGPQPAFRAYSWWAQRTPWALQELNLGQVQGRWMPYPLALSLAPHILKKQRVDI